jgi:hypothetical protein
MDTDLSKEELYTNLSLISKIEIGDKLILNNNYLTIDRSYFSFITRTIFKFGRDDTIKYITKIINVCFTYLDIEEEKPRIINYLRLSLIGLNKLKQTYINDKLVQAKIDVIIENINEKF